MWNDLPNKVKNIESYLAFKEKTEVLSKIAEFNTCMYFSKLFYHQ